jgi:hypothetical protein
MTSAVIQVGFYVFVVVLSASTVLMVGTRVLSALVPSARVLNSVLAAADERLRMVIARPIIFLPILVALYWVLLSGHGGDLVFPEPDSEARRWGSIIAILLFYLWQYVGTAYTGGIGVLSVGLNKGADVEAAMRLERWFAAFIGLGPLASALYWPGPCASLGMTIALGTSLIMHLFTLRLVATIRRARSPRARETKNLAHADRLYLLHLSDLHITLSGRQRTEGGHGGNAQFASLTKRLTEGRMGEPQFLVITGDVIDRGQSEEWKEALPTLRLLHASGFRLLIAPGNHDLATAYDPAVARSFMATSTPSKRFVDSRRIKDYLDVAVELEPRLVCHDGRSLAEVLRTEEEEFGSLMEAWRLAAHAAADRLRGKRLPWLGRPDLDHPTPRALDTLLTVDRIEGERLLEPVLERAATAFSREDMHVDKQGIRREFISPARFQFSPLLEKIRWQRLWYGAFPIRLVDEKARVEHIIVNSSAPEPGLLGSAVGRMGDAQVNRLRELVASCRAETLVLLMHHSICGWADEEVDRPESGSISVKRWALLAHESGECWKLVEILGRDAPETCRRVFLCSGHRHGHSRVGQVMDDDSADTPYPRLFLLADVDS